MDGLVSSPDVNELKVKLYDERETPNAKDKANFDPLWQETRYGNIPLENHSKEKQGTPKIDFSWSQKSRKSPEKRL